MPGGHKKVLAAMDHFQKFAVERIRFQVINGVLQCIRMRNFTAPRARLYYAQTLIVDLTRSLDEPQDSANLQIAVLSFFNAIINYRAGQVRHQ